MTLIHTSDWWAVTKPWVSVATTIRGSRPFGALLESTVFVILHLVVVYLHLIHNVWSRGAFNKQVCAEREGQDKGTEMLFVFFITLQSQGP